MKEQYVLASKTLIGFNYQEEEGLLQGDDLDKMKEILADAAEYKDIFLMKTAYQLITDLAESGTKKIEVALEKAYDFSKNSYGSLTVDDDEYIAD